MWHFEYTVGSMFFRFGADSFEACLTALIVARASNPLLTDPKIYNGGTVVVGTGALHFNQDGRVGEDRTTTAGLVPTGIAVESRVEGGEA